MRARRRRSTFQGVSFAARRVYRRVYQSGEPVVQGRPRFVRRKEGQPMAEMGYVLSSEEMTPNEMVQNARRAEETGFTTAWISDHYLPWIDAQGQSPFVWSVIGGIATATEGIRLGSDAGGSLLVRHRQRREPQRAYTRGPLAPVRREA